MPSMNTHFFAKFSYAGVCMTIVGTILYQPNLLKTRGVITPVSELTGRLLHVNGYGKKWENSSVK